MKNCLLSLGPAMKLENKACLSHSYCLNFRCSILSDEVLNVIIYHTISNANTTLLKVFKIKNHSLA